MAFVGCGRDSIHKFSLKIVPESPLGWVGKPPFGSVAAAACDPAPSCIVIVGSPPSSQVAGWQKVCKLEPNSPIIGAIHLQG